MAWHFDEVNDYVTLGDDAALTLPDGDWSLGGLVKLTDNTGSLYQYFLSWGSFAAAPSINIFFREASASDPNGLDMWIEDSDGSSIDHDNIGATPGISTDWQHVLYVRSGAGSITLYIDNVATHTEANANLDAVDVASALNFGRRSDGNTSRYFGGDMAEWAKWDVALSASQRQDLTDLKSPDHHTTGLTWYVKMLADDYNEEIVPLIVTNNGSTSATHPDITYPVAPTGHGPLLGHSRNKMIVSA